MYAGTSGITFLQNIVDGSQPIAIFSSLDKSVEFLGGLDIPNFYNKAEVGNLITCVKYYTKNQVGALIYNINLVDSYTKAETDSQLTGYTTIAYLQGSYMTTLSITEALMNNYATVTFIVDSFYSIEIDSTLSYYITSTQIDASCYTKSNIDTT